MRRNRHNIWEWLEESTEGPSVTLTLPRDVAEQLLSMIGAALEVDDMEGGDELGFDAGPPGGDDAGIDVPLDDIDDAPPGFGAGADDDMGMDMMPAGDDSDDEPPPPKKKSPPPKKGDGGDKPKKKDDGGEKPKKKDDGEKKESVSESVRRLGAYVPRGRR